MKACWKGTLEIVYEPDEEDVMMNPDLPEECERNWRELPGLILQILRDRLSSDMTVILRTEETSVQK